MPEIEEKADYLLHFAGKKREEALKNALDIRKFEIDLYWKRAGYFWAFIALSFAAYFAVATNAKKLCDMQSDLLLISSGAGLFFSLCWYCVEKGSKYWQENWEKHVDWLEDEVMGPLYKRILAYKNGSVSRFLPTKPYPFSVSKINQLLSLSICLIWGFLYVSNFMRISKCNIPAIVITLVLVVFIFLLFLCCKTGCYHDSDSNEDKMKKRE
jgi:hypothetical protein